MGLDNIKQDRIPENPLEGWRVINSKIHCPSCAEEEVADARSRMVTAKVTQLKDSPELRAKGSVRCAGGAGCENEIHFSDEQETGSDA